MNRSYLSTSPLLSVETGRRCHLVDSKRIDPSVLPDFPDPLPYRLKGKSVFKSNNLVKAT